MNLDSWNTRCGYEADDQDLLDELFTKDELSWIEDNKSQYKGAESIIKKIAIPNWANIDDGYRPVNAERIGNTKDDFAVIITYSPTSTLGIGYKRVFIVEKSTKKPFPRNREMWAELRNRSLAKQKNTLPASPYINIPYTSTVFLKGFNIPDNITISENGELRSAFGVPKTEEIYGIIFEFGSIYNDWCKFPNETDYAVIEALKEAKNKIRNMQRHANEFESQIEESRQLIKEQQERIAEFEKQMNKMYEEGADAMNLLEEHGVKFNLNGEIQDDDDAFPGLPKVMMDQLITMPYDPGSLITIDHSDSDCTKDISSNWGVLDHKLV